MPSPITIRQEDFRIFSLSDNNPIRALFAFPCSAGSETRTHSSPFTVNSTIWFSLDPAETFTDNFNNLIVGKNQRCYWME